MAFLVHFSSIIAMQFWEEAAIDFYALTYETQHFWNKNGKLKPSHNHFKKWELGLCAECSPTAYDLIGIKAYYDRIEETMDGNICGFGDFEVGWVHRICPKSFPEFWGRMLVIIPAGKEKASLRYGRLGVEADLFYSTAFSLFNYPIGSLWGIGYRAYYGYPSDQVRFYCDLTGCFCSTWHWLCQTHFECGVFNGKRQENFNQILYNPNYRLLKIQITLSKYLTDWSYFTGGYFQHLWGENVGNRGGFIGGFGFIF